MKIIALQAENIKKLVAVEIKPDGNMVQITGRNGQGKTSILDSIWWALAGVNVIQDDPIRHGQTQARIRLDLGEIVVTRTFKQGKPSAITVENAEGSKFPSPQAMLDGLLGQLSFDPLAFARMKPKDQFEALRRFVPGVDFEAMDAANKADYARRTDLNRRAKEARTLAESIVVAPGLPANPINETSLVDDLQKAASHNADIENRKSNRARFRMDIDQKKQEANNLQARARLLLDEVEALEKKLNAAGPLPEPVDEKAVRQLVDQAKSINWQIGLREEKNAHIESAAELEDEAKKLTEKMEQRDKEKIAAIAAANLPVKGLTFGEGIILMNGVPFNQGSDAEQLRASIAIAMASNSKLRVVRVRDGSLLDEDSMKILEEMAQKNDMQVWIERVDSSGKVGFVLEDGHVKHDLIEGDE